jgi:hypothetical protein
MEEPPYAAVQREVQRKLGRCLIRIQQYELLLKEVVAKREVAGMLGVAPIRFVDSASAASNMTMGKLVGELTDKFFQPTLLESGQSQSDEAVDTEEHPAGWASIRSSVSMPPDAHAQLKAELQELVDLRNDLVHHFVEGQDLMSEEGCIAADMYLQDCYAEIDRHLVSLDGWATSMNDAKRSLAAFITSPEYKEFLRAELPPPTSLREAGLPRLIQLLTNAEEELTAGGWTSLDAAIVYIRKLSPEVGPKSHTFGSWRQVLVESGAFEIRRGPAVPGGRMETRYRSRQRSL